MKNLRPLKSIALAMSKWARQGGMQTTVQFSGRIRSSVDSLGIGLLHMSRGYQYDTRTFMRRLSDKSACWHIRMAFHQIQGKQSAP